VRSEDERFQFAEGGAYLEVRLLSEMDGMPATSQRKLAVRVGMALGMTNLLIKNLAQKGYVRVNQAGWRNWVYTLTPAGISRKVSLTTAYIGRVLSHYQTIRQTLRERLEPLGLPADSRVAVYGVGEVAELLYMGLRELGITDVDFFARAPEPTATFLGMSVRPLSDMRPDNYHRVLIAALDDDSRFRGELEEVGVPTGALFTLLPAPGAPPSLPASARDDGGDD